MAHPGGFLHNDVLDDKGWFVRRSIRRYDRTKELLLLLHGDGVLGKLVWAFGKKHDRSRMMSHMLLHVVPFPGSSRSLQLFSDDDRDPLNVRASPILFLQSSLFRTHSKSQ